MDSAGETERRLHALVSGRVQGVGFRWYVIETVRRTLPRVTGWVKNLPDGRVEVLAEGPEDQLDRLLTALGRGPSYARVTDVQEEWSPARGGLHGFDATY